MAHIPVLYHEIIHAINPHDGGLYLDGTVGAGGHAWSILEHSTPGGKLLGLDLDPIALSLAKHYLSKFGDRVVLRRASFTSISKQINEIGWHQVDGIILDLGVSSMQLDDRSRGFSFLGDAPLDMRFNPDGLVTASDLVNGLPEKNLADLIYRYGEERKSRRIAKQIVESRPIHTTAELAHVINQVVQRGKDGIHPATRTFQALRIATNDELRNLKQVLPEAVASLVPGGRVAVISFHSLEDRIVKQYFRQESQDCICPPKQVICTCGHKASIRQVTRRPIRPEKNEVETNPRARSARLRIAEKI